MNLKAQPLMIRHAALRDSGLTRFCADRLTPSQLYVQGQVFSVIRLYHLESYMCM